MTASVAALIKQGIITVSGDGILYCRLCEVTLTPGVDEHACACKMTQSYAVDLSAMPGHSVDDKLPEGVADHCRKIRDGTALVLVVCPNLKQPKSALLQVMLLIAPTLLALEPNDMGLFATHKMARILVGYYTGFILRGRNRISDPFLMVSRSIRKRGNSGVSDKLDR